MKELLLSKGWIRTSGCKCGGVAKEEYQHSARPGEVIKIYPGKQKYRASKGGRKLSEGPAAQLENYLNALTA